MLDNSLDRFAKRYEFLIGIDSDGCAFDTMEIKHKECFIPAFIKHMGLQPVSKYAREACEFVNLYSKWRGANRFPAYLKALDLLAERPEVKKRGAAVPELKGLRDWVKRESRLGNPTLKAEVERTRRLEEHPIPQGFPYEQIGALKVEARQKLSRFRPATVGQASRIAGVTAADIAVLLVHLKRLSSSKSH